jgi:hypothetical protein
VAFVLVFVITMLPVALTRINDYGMSGGHVIYYQQSLQFMFLILAAFAISPRWSGRRTQPVFGNGPRLLLLRRPSRRILTVGGAAALAAYAVLLVTSLSAMARASWQPRQDSAYVSTYLASDKLVRAKTGVEPVLVDLKVPKQVLPTKLWPYTTYGEFFALFNPKLRVDRIAEPTYVLSRRGRLLPVRFVASTGGLLAKASVGEQLGSAGAPAAMRDRSSACAPATASMSWLRVPLAHPQRMSAQANDLAYAFQARFRMPASSWVSDKLLAWPRGRGFATVTHLWGRGTGGELIPLQFTGQVRDLAFHLPARACITSIEFGRLRFTQAAS